MSGRYKAYGEYKDSGVEWLGEIPEGWSLTRMKFAAKINMGQSPSSDDCNSESVGTPFLQGNAEFGKLNPYAKQYCPFPKKIANIGDLLFSVRAPVGALNMADKIYGIGRGLCSISNSKYLHKNFLWWVLPSYKYQFDAIATGSTFEAVSAEQVENLYFSLPKIQHQNQIAAFLDHETAKIDTLIDKQQQLIELLKEKRQAVISHAVTKGLDPDVPMKDSGVEWLGEVPEHWKVLAIKKIVSTPITDGPHETPNFIDEGISFISAEAISSGVIDFSKQRACISIKDHIRFSEKYKPHLYDIYMVKSGATTGVSAIVETINDFNIWSPLAALRCSEIAFPYFVLYFLRSQQFLTAIELNWSFGTQQNIGMGVIGNIYISCPPIKEAIIISDHIRQKCSKIESLITLATHQISLMQERRTALISAAVTGKIDVRDWQVPATQTESDEVMA